MFLKNFKKIILIIFVISIVNDIYSQETVQWSINKISGKKAGASISGPFDSFDQALANWIYLSLVDNKKNCITENAEIKTKSPSADYKTEYDLIFSEFIDNREQFIDKYNIKLNSRIEKSYQKKNKNKSNKNEEKKSEKKTFTRGLRIEGPTIDDLKKIEQETIEQKQYEKEKKQMELEEKAEKERLEKELLELESMIKAQKKEQDALVKLIESTKHAAPMEFSKKEYLQDFLVPEESLIPEYEIQYDYEKITDPDKTNSFGQTLLMQAAKAGNEWQMKNLILQGADVNIQDNDGWTALMYAVRYQESLSAINLLLNANADVKLRNNFDSSALVIGVVYNNNPNVIRKLLEYYNISEKDVMKAFVMLLTSHSSEYNQVAKVNVFIEKAVPLNTFYEGKTPLMYAAQFCSSTKIIKILIDNNSITSLRSTEGKTAFEYGIENKNLQQDSNFWLLNKNN